MKAWAAVAALFWIISNIVPLKGDAGERNLPVNGTGFRVEDATTCGEWDWGELSVRNRSQNVPERRLAMQLVAVREVYAPGQIEIGRLPLAAAPTGNRIRFLGINCDSANWVTFCGLLGLVAHFPLRNIQLWFPSIGDMGCENSGRGNIARRQVAKILNRNVIAQIDPLSPLPLRQDQVGRGDGHANPRPLFGPHLAQLVPENPSSKGRTDDADESGEEQQPRIASHFFGGRSYQVFIGTLLLLLGSPFAVRVPQLQERQNKTASDYAKIFGCTALALIFDFFGLGLIIGILAI